MTKKSLEYILEYILKAAETMSTEYNFPLNDTEVKKDIKIDKIVTVYDFEFSSEYYYSGERHNFWEMVYVDSGSIDIIADTRGYRLKQGDLAFHKPDEFHALSSTGDNAPSVIVVSFVSSSPAMKFFEGRILNIPCDQRILIYDIISEAKNVFNESLGHVYLDANRSEDAVFGGEQLLYANLEKALVIFYRSCNESVKDIRMSGDIESRFDTALTDLIIQYLNENINSNIKLDDICAKFFISKTQLKVTFKKNTGQSVISYFIQLKMQEAKKMIRQGGMSTTEISNALGFSNVHYFSASFKTRFKMSPTEYHLSVKAYEEKIRGK